MSKTKKQTMGSLTLTAASIVKRITTGRGNRCRFVCLTTLIVTFAILAGCAATRQNQIPEVGVFEYYPQFANLRPDSLRYGVLCDAEITVSYADWIIRKNADGIGPKGHSFKSVALDEDADVWEVRFYRKAERETVLYLSKGNGEVLGVWTNNIGADDVVRENQLLEVGVFEYSPELANLDSEPLKNDILCDAEITIAYVNWVLQKEDEHMEAQLAAMEKGTSRYYSAEAEDEGFRGRSFKSISLDEDAGVWEVRLDYDIEYSKKYIRHMEMVLYLSKETGAVLGVTHNAL